MGISRRSARALTWALLGLALTTSQYHTITADQRFHPSASARPNTAAVVTADVTVSIDTGSTRPISPYIYGSNQNLGAPQYTFGRLGGNNWSGFNWVINASNAGIDWFNWNYDYLPWILGVPASQYGIPGVTILAGLDHIFGSQGSPPTSAGAAVITVPILGYVAADRGTSPNADVNTSGPNYLQLRFKPVQHVKGAPFSTNAAVLAAQPQIYTDEYANWVKTVAKAAHPGRSVFYSLDNEPDLWFETHPRIALHQESYNSLASKEEAAAGAIKSADASATVFGFVSYGWYGYTYLQGAPDGSMSDHATYGDFTEYYLGRMKDAETRAGKRLIDVLDLHYYTSAQTPDRAKEVQSSDVSPEVVAARVQSTRSLWDPTYVENSWITRDGLPAGDRPIRLIPRMQAKIDAKYPGTKLAITEYNFRGGPHISGAIAQADALGIFGRYGVFAASRWQMDNDESFEEAAFKMYRGFDGAQANFGDVSVAAISSDVAKVAAYASLDSTTPGRAVVVAINRSTAPQNVALNGLGISGTASVYRMTAAAAQPVFVGQVPAAAASWIVTLPAMSISTFDVRASTACAFSLSAASASVLWGVNTGAVTLTASTGSCGWTVASNAAFITVTSSSSGTGTSLVTWAVAINSSPSPRSGTLTIAGLTYTITQAGASTTRRVPNDFNHDGLTDLAVFRPSLARWLVAGQSAADWGAVGDLPVPGDYDGTGTAEYAVFRPATGTWYISGGATLVWGAAGDIPVPADYNGDGTTDLAVFRPSTGQFLLRNIGTFAWGLAGDLPVVADYNGDGAADIAVFRPATGMWYIRNVMNVVWGGAADVPVPADYNGDGHADLAVFRAATGTWFIKDQYTRVWGAAGDVPVPLDRSGDGVAELGVFRRATGTWLFENHVTGAGETVALGATGDLPLGRSLPAVQTPWGDYDGDRKADLTVFRPSTGDWVSLRSLGSMSDYTLRTWGLPGDLPVGRDYDGDGVVDPAVYRPSLGRWLVLRSASGYSAYTAQDWGLATDTPVPADYDGDGKADFAVFRPALGRWVILLSSTGNASYVQYDFGLTGDIPVPADYDGDGRADVAVFRPSAGRWYILNRLAGTYITRDWGLAGDTPVAADFDGDGKADVAVFRPTLGRWFVTASVDGSYQIVDWGLSGDDVVPADYDGDGRADLAVFRPATGRWYVRNLFMRDWGASGDVPALKNP